MVWEFAELVGRRLVVWALASAAVGLALLALGDAVARGFGVQALVWGAIDGAIGLIGIRGASRDRRAGRGDPEAPVRGARKLRRLLLLNVVLDAGYVVGGLLLATVVDPGDPFTVGSGWGIVVQGAFLFVFDLLHARWVPDPRATLPVDGGLFAGDEHAPTVLRPPGSGIGPGARSIDEAEADLAGGAAATGRAARVSGRASGPPIALLVHGFAGTPAELRPIGEALAAAGWEARLPLLPGMGARIGELADATAEDWLDAVVAAAGDPAARAGRRLLVVGYSLGGALALATAERVRPDGIALVAPFWWPRPWWRPFAPLVRAFLPTGVRPFARLDLDDPAARTGVAGFLPGLDLDDPATRTWLGELRVPLGLFTQLFTVSDRAFAGARRVAAPVAIVQGSADTVVLPARTRLLADRLGTADPIVEVAAGHDLVLERAGVLDAVRAPILGLAARLLREGSLPRDAAA